MRDYTLTEPICLQAVIIKTISKGWNEWFSNPTAGPWKRIRIPGVSSLEQMGFEKEETRPDLITFRDGQNPLVLILEIKDDISKLIDENNENKQLIKTVNVFNVIRSRLIKILEKENDLKINTKSILYCGGYVVSKTKSLDEQIETLKKLHFLKTKTMHHDLKQFVLFIVEKKDLDLHVTCQVFSEDTPSPRLQKII